MSTDPTKMNRMNFTNANPRFSATVDNSISMYTKDIEDCMERAMGIFKQEIGECTQRAIRGLQEHIKMFVADVNDKGESLSTLPVEQSAPQTKFPTEDIIPQTRNILPASLVRRPHVPHLSTKWQSHPLRPSPNWTHIDDIQANVEVKLEEHAEPQREMPSLLSLSSDSTFASGPWPRLWITSNHHSIPNVQPDIYPSKKQKQQRITGDDAYSVNLIGEVTYLNVKALGTKNDPVWTGLDHVNSKDLFKITAVSSSNYRATMTFERENCTPLTLCLAISRGEYNIMLGIVPFY